MFISTIAEQCAKKSTCKIDDEVHIQLYSLVHIEKTQQSKSSWNRFLVWCGVRPPQDMVPSKHLLKLSYSCWVHRIEVSCVPHGNDPTCYDVRILRFDPKAYIQKYGFGSTKAIMFEHDDIGYEQTIVIPFQAKKICFHVQYTDILPPPRE